MGSALLQSWPLLQLPLGVVPPALLAQPLGAARASCMSGLLAAATSACARSRCSMPGAMSGDARGEAAASLVQTGCRQELCIPSHPARW